MKTKLILGLTLVTALVLLSGCGSEQAKMGFLSDYSKLQKESGSSLRYVDQKAVADYTGFIVDPVKAILGEESKSKLTTEQITDLTNYTHTKIVEAIEAAGKKIVYQPGAGVARVRVALTDMDKSSALSLIPHVSLLGVGIGGASMEAEVVDTLTGNQIGAVVESSQGSRLPFSNLGDWTATKKVIDGWAERFQKRLEEAK